MSRRGAVIVILLIRDLHQRYSGISDRASGSGQCACLVVQVRRRDGEMFAGKREKQSSKHVHSLIYIYIYTYIYLYIYIYTYYTA